MVDQTSALLDGLVLRPHHTAVSVEDFDAALAFFRDVVGMRVEKQADRRSEEALGVVVGLPGAVIRWAMLEHNDYRFELFKYLEPQGRKIEFRQCDHTITHVAFQVSDTDEVCRRVRAAGYRTYSDPQDLRGGVTRPIYVEGPEGVVVEFLEIRG